MDLLANKHRTLRDPRGNRLPILVSLLSLSLALCPATMLTARGEDSGSPGHYDQNKVAASSVVFGALAERLLEDYEPVDLAVRRVDGLLADLDLNLALSAGHTDTTHHDLWMARLDERSNLFGTEFEAVQNYSYALQDGTSKAFEEALSQAVETLAAGGAEPAPCLESSGALDQMTRPGAVSSSSCPGKDLSAAIASNLDSDKSLVAALEALQTGTWPTVTDYSATAATLGIGNRPAGRTWLSPAQLARAIPEAVHFIDSVEERAQEGRDRLWEAFHAIPEDDPKVARETKLAIRTRALGIRTYSVSKKGELGAVLWGAVDRARRKGKRAGWDDVTICLNPTGWSGCEGTDRTDEVRAVLLDDRKLEKTLLKLQQNVSKPDTTIP